MSKRGQQWKVWKCFHGSTDFHTFHDKWRCSNNLPVLYIHAFLARCTGTTIYFKNSDDIKYSVSTGLTSKLIEVLSVLLVLILLLNMLYLFSANLKAFNLIYTVWTFFRNTFPKNFFLFVEWFLDSVLCPNSNFMIMTCNFSFTANKYFISQKPIRKLNSVTKNIFFF